MIPDIYFQFCVLPFALTSSTKVLWPFSKQSRGRGIKAIIYIDDRIAALRGFEVTKSVSKLVINDFLSFGFVINNEKSDFNPKTKKNWLATTIGIR